MPITDSTPPPSRAASGVPRTPRQAPHAAVTAARTDAVAQLGMFAQVPLTALKQYADVGAVSMHWPVIATEVAKLADQQEEVAKLIDPLLKVGPYAGLIAAVLPLAMQIACNHGRVPAGAMGSVPPAVLSAQVETAIARQELEALTIQRNAEKDARKIRNDIAAERQLAEQDLGE